MRKCWVEEMDVSEDATLIEAANRVLGFLIIRDHIAVKRWITDFDFLKCRARRVGPHLDPMDIRPIVLEKRVPLTLFHHITDHLIEDGNFVSNRLLVHSIIPVIE